MATYTVTATGASGTATTSFTDGNVTVKAKSGSTNLAVNFPIGSVERFGSGLSSASNTNCSGPATQTNAGSFNTPSNNQYTNSFVTANNFQSVKLTAPSPVTVGSGSSAITYNFSHWTADSPTDLLVLSDTGCIDRVTTQSNDPAWQISANYGRQTTTALTSSANPSTYGNNVTFTATVSASGGTNPNSFGTVAFKDGTNTISGCGSVPLSGNTATCTTSVANANLLSAAGSPHSITAEYSGTTAGTILFAKSTSSALSQVVNPKALTVAGITANNKVYDGGTSATLDFTNAQLNGVLSGDLNDVSLDTSSYTANFADKNAANGKAVTVADLGLSGSKASNYTLTQPTGLTANIDKAPSTTTVSCTAGPFTYNGSAHTPCSADVTGA